MKVGSMCYNLEKVLRCFQIMTRDCKAVFWKLGPHVSVVSQSLLIVSIVALKSDVLTVIYVNIKSHKP